MRRSSPSQRRARLLCVVASELVLGATIVVMGALTPGYSQWSETVSRLGSSGQPLAPLARAGLVLHGILVLVGATPLGDHGPGKERLLAGLISLYGMAAVTAGIAPKDAPLGPHTVINQIHIDATVVGGMGIVAAMVVVAACSPLASARLTSTLVAAFSVMAVIIFRFSWGSPIYGLIERVLLALTASWLVALALRALSPGGAEELGEDLVRVAVEALAAEPLAHPHDIAVHEVEALGVEQQVGGLWEVDDRDPTLPPQHVER